MKILLGSLSIEPESRMQDSPNAAYSMGLTYLYSSLEQAGHEVKLCFLNNFAADTSESAFFAEVSAWQPDVVGLQVFSMNRTASFAAIERLTREFPNTKIVIGGIHTSVMYAQILNKYRNVIAVIGEGEITLNELLDVFENNGEIESVKGIAYFLDGKLVVSEPRRLLPDLDCLPFQKHDIFFKQEPERTVGHVISSRGCPFDCSFCCLKVISQRRYRERDIRLVIAEIVELKRKYPRLRQIQFHDDTFLLNNRRVIEFCKGIIPHQLGISFVCSARVKPISSEMFSWMEKAGFVKIMFGLETGSAKLLGSIHKEISKDDVVELFQVIKPYNFVVTTFIMCGFPGEDDDTIQETIDLVQRTQKIYYNWIAGIGKLWVYPGTEVYEIMKKSGKINDGYWMTEQCVPHFTAERDLQCLIEFENRLMDSLSISRILTYKGFVNHFLQMPFGVMKFIAKNKHVIIDILCQPLRIDSVAVHKFIIRFLHKVGRVPVQINERNRPVEEEQQSK